jgi:predicted secreted protein
MKRNVVLAATARLAASFLALLLIALGPAMGAERALLNVIGYDADGKYFAFEEYGIGDGSGGAYSHIYVVDLAADKWVYGSPFSVDTLEDADPEAKPLAQVRAEALAKAQDKLKPLKIGTPASILALNGDGEHGDMQRMRFWTPNCCGPDRTEDTAFTLALTTLPAKGADDCQDSYAEGQAVLGFMLTLDDGGDEVVLHRDGDTLPRSRGCTLAYGIYTVVAQMNSGGSRVAIIESWPFGFEGPDRRFIAVPIDSP